MGAGEGDDSWRMAWRGYRERYQDAYSLEVSPLTALSVINNSCPDLPAKWQKLVEFILLDAMHFLPSTMK